MAKIRGENHELHKKIRDQSRRLEKVTDHSYRGLSLKSAVRHRELEYMSKRDFRNFYHKLQETFEIVFKCFKDAFKRDAKIVQNLLESHLHPSGKAVMVNKDTHQELK